MIISSFCLIFYTLFAGFPGLQNYYTSLIPATFFAGKVFNRPQKFPKIKSQATHNKQLAHFINTKSFPFLKICQLHLITYKVQQTHRSDKMVGFVFFVSSTSASDAR